ncbi:MAG: ribonuclease P protein component [Pseudarcicella sp.]|nr:ribonuclease P protein component [Pseudarcicella sp.]MBP6409731.1 ribonuclease P protein component [Pseudarcicella sp.]
MTHTFKKSERLSSKKIIEELFNKKGSEAVLTAFHYPFRVSYIKKNSVSTKIDFENADLETNLLEQNNTTKTQILVSVSKRLFKKAVDRNLVKRRTKEAYRLNKQLNLEKKAAFEQAQNKITYIGFVYIGKNIESFRKIEKSMIIILNKINA